MYRAVKTYLAACMLLVLASCIDNALVDTSEVITDRNWSYIKKVQIPVTITDHTKAYNLYFNLRHTAGYQYSNIFVLVHQSGPGMKPLTERKEFQLAYPDGEWLGSGSGNLYSYQLPVRENYTFPQNGTYIFELEQNMRDNPLREISDVGMRIAPAK